VASNPGPKPPNQAATITAADKSRNGDWGIGVWASSNLAVTNNTTDTTATP
jgi:hypothetical protein